MRKLTYWVGITIDGFIAGPEGEVDFYPLGDLLPYMVAEYPDVIPTHLREALGMPAGTPNRHFDTVVQARATYEPALEAGIPSPYAHLRQYVVSGSIGKSPDPAVELISGDVVERVRQLKAEEGAGIYLAGGGNLAGQLVDEIDELIVKIYPVIAMSGIPLFAGDFRPVRFELAEHRVFDTGEAVMTYTRKR